MTCSKHSLGISHHESLTSIKEEEGGEWESLQKGGFGDDNSDVWSHPEHRCFSGTEQLLIQ